MIVDIDFREKYLYLAPSLIHHWEEPHENIQIDNNEKKRILNNIKDFLLLRRTADRIIMEE